MRIATLRGRLTLLTGTGVGPAVPAATVGVDVETASKGQFGADPQAVFTKWSAFRSWAPGFRGAATVPIVDAELGAPAPAPVQVFGIGLNYRDHAAESGLPLPDRPATFTKFPSCIAGPCAEVELPSPAVDIGATRKPPRFLQPGDLLTSYVEGIGTLLNRCTASSTAR